MASGYELPIELRTLEKMFKQLTYQSGRDSVTVFGDFLSYIIFGFNPTPKPDPSWKYKKSENRQFHDMMIEYFTVMDKMVSKRGWYDAFGDFFMAVVGRTSRQYRGQFFTPHTICDFMAKIILGERGEYPDTPSVTCGAFGRRVIVGDPTAGSARLLLAAHADLCSKNYPNHYMVAEDIDALCCKMSAINLCVHGCFGEVVCHDTLQHPDSVVFGYKINEMMHPFPVCPSIRPVDNPEAFVCTTVARNLMRRHAVDVPAEVDEESNHKNENKAAKRKQPLQLELNFL